MNLSHRTHRAEKIAISKARAAAHAATELGKAPDKYANRTEWQDRMLAAMMEDAKAVRAAFRENNHMPGAQVQSNDPTKVQQKVFDALAPKATAADVGKITGMSASNVRHTMLALEKKGHVKRHLTNPLTWSKA